jgi:hypothetical protein
MTEDERRALWAAALGISPAELPGGHAAPPEKPRPEPRRRPLPRTG